MTERQWDRPMSRADKQRLSPKDKNRRDVTSLERKIAVIEQAASRSDTTPSRTDLPTDRAKLRRWESAEDGLWPWSDATFDSPTGRNATLIKRFQAAVERLQRNRRRGKAGLREDLGHAKTQIAFLDQQIADLIGQNRQLRVELSRARGAR